MLSMKLNIMTIKRSKRREHLSWLAKFLIKWTFEPQHLDVERRLYCFLNTLQLTWLRSETVMVSSSLQGRRGTNASLWYFALMNVDFVGLKNMKTTISQKLAIWMKKYKLLNHIVTHFFEFCFQGCLFSIQLCIQKFILKHHLPNGRSLCSQANSCLNNYPNSTWMITIPLHYWSTRG